MVSFLRSQLDKLAIQYLQDLVITESVKQPQPELLLTHGRAGLMAFLLLLSRGLLRAGRGGVPGLPLALLFLLLLLVLDWITRRCLRRRHRLLFLGRLFLRGRDTNRLRLLLLLLGLGLRVLDSLSGGVRHRRAAEHNNHTKLS